MRAGVLSAALLGIAHPATSREKPLERKETLAAVRRWDPDRFANEQIRGLVHRVFDPEVAVPVRQVAFSAIDTETEVFGICQRVAECLATETMKEVAIVASDAQLPACATLDIRFHTSIRRRATRLRNNVWLVCVEDVTVPEADSFRTCLEEVRHAFDYSIVALSPNETVTMGHLADGLILVLSALRTRRASARQFRDALSQVRLLGTVLSDREFAIPEGIYRNL